MLTDDDRAIIDLEARWWKHRGTKEVAIVDELGIRPPRYYQRLHALCRQPEALEYRPAVVRRVLRQAEVARVARRLA